MRKPGGFVVRNDHEFTLVFVDGTRRRLSLAWIARSLLNRTGLGLVLLAVVPALMITPRVTSEGYPFWVSPLVKLTALVLFVVCFLCILACAARLMRALGSRAVLEPVVTALAVLPVTLAHRTCADMTALCTTNHSLVAAYLRDLLFWQCLSILFFLFLLRPQRSDRSEEDTEENPARTIRIGSRDFLRNEIDRIDVEDHLLRISCGAQTHLVHGSLADVTEQLGAWRGLRLHRSHWVALRNIDRLETVDRRTFVRLRCGDVLPLARGRRSKVEKALRHKGSPA